MAPATMVMARLQQSQQHRGALTSAAMPMLMAKLEQRCRQRGARWTPELEKPSSGHVRTRSLLFDEKYQYYCTMAYISSERVSEVFPTNQKKRKVMSSSTPTSASPSQSSPSCIGCQQLLDVFYWVPSMSIYFNSFYIDLHRI